MSSSALETLLELGEAIADQLEGNLLGPIRLGRRERYDGHLLDGRTMPMRVAHVKLAGPVHDSIVLVSGLTDEVLRSTVELAISGIAARIGIDELPIPGIETFEFDELATARDDMDALWDCPCVGIETGQGQLLVIVTDRVLRDAERIIRNGGAAGSEAPSEPGLDEAGGTPDQAAAQELELPELGQPTGSVAGATPPAAPPAASGATWSELLQGVPVEVTAELGQTNLALGRITDLGSGSVLTLDEQVGEPVRIFVNGALYAHARLVVVDGEYGVEVEEVLGAAPATALGGVAGTLGG